MHFSFLSYDISRFLFVVALHFKVVI